MRPSKTDISDLERARSSESFMRDLTVECELSLPAGKSNRKGTRRGLTRVPILSRVAGNAKLSVVEDGMD